MDIKRNSSRPSGKGPAEYFTGAVRVDPLFEALDPARVRGAHVTFEPGARTARRRREGPHQAGQG
jgi:quercetin dioxygenase-like cupin family protein